MIRKTCYFVAVGLVCTPATWAQSRNLHSDLQDLNVRVRSEHYALAGTADDARLNEFGQVLEFIHAEYAKGFAELLSIPDGSGAKKSSRRGLSRPTPVRTASIQDFQTTRGGGTEAEERFSVVVLSRQSEYREFTRAYFGEKMDDTLGLFVSAADLLVILDAGDRNNTYETLFHEAFHQFLHRYVPFAPMWINEGLATYFESARPTAEGLRFDRPRTAFFQVMKDAVDARTLIPLDELLTADHSDFNASDVVRGLSHPSGVLYYAHAYTLCAFMLSNAEGASFLRRYVQTLADADSAGDADDITDETFSATLLDQISPAWLQYVNKY